MVLSKGAKQQLPPLPAVKGVEREPVTLQESELAHILIALRMKRTTLVDRMRRNWLSREKARSHLPCDEYW